MNAILSTYVIEPHRWGRASPMSQTQECVVISMFISALYYLYNCPHSPYPMRTIHPVMRLKISHPGI